MEYYVPRTPRETLKLLDRYGDKAAILAGGTELVVAMKAGNRTPGALINIKKIDALKKFECMKSKVRLGPLVTLTELEDSEFLQQHIPILPQVATLIGSRQIRNIATIGGNIANASPCADMVPPLIALDARVKLFSLQGKEDILVENFFLGPGETVAGSDKLLGPVEVKIPGRATRISHQFITLRRSMDVTIASIVVRIDVKSRVIRQARIVMGAVAPTPARSKNGETLLLDCGLNDIDIDAVAAAAADECKPIDDVRASSGYRREMVRVLTRKALEEILN
jgi:carbon-monoxide dehydrogenase medium subunit